MSGFLKGVTVTTAVGASPSCADELDASVEAFLRTGELSGDVEYINYTDCKERAASALLQGDYRGTIFYLDGLDDIDSLIMRATAQTRLEEFDAAWGTLERIARMYPEHPELKTLQLMVSGSASRLGKHCGADVGRALMREMRNQSPDYHITEDVQSHFRHGRFAEGYSICLEFLSSYEGDRHYPTLRGMVPHWDGRHVSSLLIVGLFGFGDQIQYARFIRHARSKAKHITLAVPPQLTRLFADCGADVVVRNDVPLDIQPAEAYVLCFWLLPALLGIHHYCETPYLRASSTLKRSRALQVGLCWTAGPVDVCGRSASLADCEALRTVRRVEWHSLVPSSGSTWMRIHNPKDFADTAGVVAGLDLVITVDTAVAHLAGAMGKPVWVLLPTDGDWRWGADETTTPLYPSARLFRRRADESWRRLIDRVRSALKTEAHRIRAHSPMTNMPTTRHAERTEGVQQ